MDQLLNYDFALENNGQIEWEFDKENPAKTSFDWGMVSYSDISGTNAGKTPSDTSYTFGIVKYTENLNMGSLCYLKAKFDVSDGVRYIRTQEPRIEIDSDEKASAIKWGQKYMINVFAKVENSH
jgi:hypothetical protein